MSFTDRFKRSWELTKHTFAVMKQDKEILLLPILSTIFSIILFFIFLFPIFISSLADAGIFLYLAIFGLYFGTTFAATFFNAALVHIAKTRFTGGDATLMDGLGAAAKHLPQILGWSALAATIGLILNILESKAREDGNIIARIVISFIGLAWSIVSLFVVPAIVLKGYGPIEALKKSAATVKQTWGESLIKYLGIGLIRSAFIAAGIFLFIVPAILLFFGAYVIPGAVILAVGILYIMIVSIIFSAANTIFDTALFLYADTGKVPSAYSKEELDHAFKRK